MIYPNGIAYMVSQHLSSSVFDMAAPLTRINLFVGIGDIIRYVLLNSMRAKDYNWPPTLVFMSGLWLGVGLAYLLTFHTKVGLMGLGIGPLIGLTISNTILALMWKKTFSLSQLQQQDSLESPFSTGTFKNSRCCLWPCSIRCRTKNLSCRKCYCCSPNAC